MRILQVTCYVIEGLVLEMAVKADGNSLQMSLDLQLSEVEMLNSMFPGGEEFQLDDPCAVVDVQSYVNSEIPYDELHCRIGFTINLQSNSKV